MTYNLWLQCQAQARLDSPVKIEFEDHQVIAPIISNTFHFARLSFLSLQSFKISVLDYLSFSGSPCVCFQQYFLHFTVVWKIEELQVYLHSGQAKRNNRFFTAVAV
jgi:hypothetical protein